MATGISEILKASGFSRNPFVVVPPIEMDHVIWAGDTSVIESLKDAAYSPSHDNLANSELVVVIGNFGSGKTNAMKYLAKIMRDNGDIAGYLLSANVSDKPMWRDVVRALFTRVWTREEIVSRLGAFRQYVKVEAARRGASAVGEDALIKPDEVARETEKAFDELCAELEPADPGFVKFLVDLADPEGAVSQMNWQYLTAQKIKPADGSKFNLKYGLSPDGLANDYNATKILAGIIRFMTLKTEFGIGSDVVAILIDEVEGFADLANASRSSILKGLRDLFAETTENTSIILASTSSDAAELYGILDNPTMMRLSRMPIEIPQMAAADAKTFLIDLMSQARLPDYSGSVSWPFTEEGLDAVVNEMPPPIQARQLVVTVGRIVFQKYKDQVLAEQAIGAEDVAEFDQWVYGTG